MASSSLTDNNYEMTELAGQLRPDGGAVQKSLTSGWERSG